MKIATWNVNGIRARQHEVEAWLQRERPDIACFQEIKAMAEQVPPSLCALEGYWCFWHGAKGYSGVALHVSKAISAARPDFFHPSFDYESRIVAARLDGFTIASVYVPNGGKDLPTKMRFLAELKDWAGAQLAERPGLIICGDLNVARADIDVHPKERKMEAVGQLAEERALFDALLGAGVRDVARELSPGDDRLFTWWAPWRNLRQRNIGWRIDYLLASDAIAARATASVSQREMGTSDHAPVITSFAAPEQLHLPFEPSPPS